jgi:DNA sulfur modification protein DndC
VCTLVDKDKSMSAMIQNDEEKEWMLPLLELRNELDITDDRHLRDFRRMNGSVQLFHDRPIHGPYTQEARAHWLSKLLEAQTWIRANGPAHVGSLDLVTLNELEEIRRIWVVEKHEFEDRLPVIYREATGSEYPGKPLDEHLPLGAEVVDVLQQITGGDRLHFEMVRELLDIEQRHRARARRAGLFDELEKALQRGFYDDEADAVSRAQYRKDSLGSKGHGPGEVDPVDVADGYVRPTSSSDEEVSGGTVMP